MDFPKSDLAKSMVVFVPGAFHTRAHFQPISTLLSEEALPTLTIQLPTTSFEKTALYRDKENSNILSLPNLFSVTINLDRRIEFSIYSS